MEGTSILSWRRWGGVILLAVLVGGLFWPVFGYDFVQWDDNMNVIHNDMLAMPWSWRLIGEFFDPQLAMRLKPLHWLVFRVMAGWEGMNPASWHAIGFVFHVGASVAVLLVFREALRLVPWRIDPVWVDFVAWFGAAAWAVHPLRVEPVAWVTGSTYPMAMMPMAFSFWAYLKAFHSEKRGRWMVCSWFLAVAAYATYPTSVTLVVWLIATDAFLLRVMPSSPWRVDEREVRRWWFRHCVFLLPALCAVGATLWTRLAAPGNFGPAPSLTEVSWDERLLTAAASFSVFPLKLIWPVGLTPNHVQITNSAWVTGWILTGAAVFGAVALGVVCIRRKHPAWGWFWVGFVGLALPCVGLTENPTWPVDRYSYVLDVALIGAGCAGVLFFMERLKTRRLLAAALGVILLVEAGASYRLLPVWRDTDALFTHMEANPNFTRNVIQEAFIYKAWGVYLLNRQRTPEALEKFNLLNQAYFSRIRTALAEGDYREAVDLSRKLEATLGILPGLRRERAEWLIRLGNFDQGLIDLRRVLNDIPGDPRTLELMTACKASLAPGKNP